MSEALHVVCPHCGSVNRVPGAKLVARPQCGRCHAALFMGQPLGLSTGTFDDHVGRSDIPVVVDFWASWCGPCHAMAPVFEQAARLLEPDFRLAKLNTEEAPEISARFGIRSIPTLIIFKGGRELARQSGAMPMKSLLAWIRSSV
jgi:thioredoxin 2